LRPTSLPAVVPGDANRSVEIARARELNSRWILAVLALPEQLRQRVDGDPPRLVLRQHLRLPCLVIVLSRVYVRKLLPVGVPDDITVRRPVGAPGRREAA
jgi:hypothetical protein